jgi:hypothetical protein
MNFDIGVVIVSNIHFILKFPQLKQNIDLLIIFSSCLRRKCYTPLSPDTACSMMSSLFAFIVLLSQEAGISLPAILRDLPGYVTYEDSFHPFTGIWCNRKTGHGHQPWPWVQGSHLFVSGPSFLQLKSKVTDWIVSHILG